MPVFTEWESFYVIGGSSGAALTGLPFVVIALTVDVQRRSSPRTVDTFLALSGSTAAGGGSAPAGDKRA